MKRFTFDPDGDVCLVLTTTEESPRNKKIRLDENLPHTEHVALDSIPSPRITNHGLNLGIDHENASSPAEHRQVAKRKRDTESEDLGDSGNTLSPLMSQIEMLVSSRHLMLASKVLKSMLSPSFSEGIILRSRNKVQIYLFDHDPEALKIVMDIIHGYPNRVPRIIDLAMLTQISLLVDEYDLHEVLEHFSDLWIENLRPKLPSALNDTLLPWLWISWVFKKQAVFSHVTKIAKLYSTARLTPNDLLFPEIIFEQIEICRKRGIRDAILMLGKAVKRLEDPDYLCHNLESTDRGRRRICPATTLGTLIRTTKDLKLYPPPPAPYVGWSYAMYIDQIESMWITSLCAEIHKPNHSPEKCHRLDEYFQTELRKHDFMQGFNLEDFQQK